MNRSQQPLTIHGSPLSDHSPLTTHSVELNIEQLVLHGFPPRDRHRIARALQQELTRLFTEQGVPASLTGSSSADRLDAGDFGVQAHTRAETVGGRVAQSVYGGMQ